MGEFVPQQQFCNWQHKPDAKQQEAWLKCSVKKLNLPKIINMYFALFTTHTQEGLTTRASTMYFKAKREIWSMRTLCRGGAATFKQMPPQVETATCCSAASCGNTRSDLRAQPHHPNTAPELTNSVPQCRKLSWPWWCVATTALFLAPKLAWLSLHCTPLHSCSRNIMNSTQTCLKMIRVAQPRIEFKHPKSFHPKHLCTWPCQLLAQSFIIFARFMYNGKSHCL